MLVDLLLFFIGFIVTVVVFSVLVQVIFTFWSY